MTDVTPKSLKTLDFKGYCDRKKQAQPELKDNEGKPAATYVGKFGALPAGTGRDADPGLHKGECMSKPMLMWVDCTSGLPDTEPRVWTASVFEVLLVQGTEAASRELVRGRFQAVCFECDYPDQSCLKAMQAIKQLHPRLPMLMLTLDHSESLAVWAFRSRMWNYLVKPVPQGELLENLRSLANLGQRSSPPRTAQPLRADLPQELPEQPIPPEVARLQPALRYVASNYHQRVSADIVAKACGLTRFEFSRRFREAFNTTFREYLMRFRIAEARRLLTEGRVSITGIAYSVGFNDGSHFARMFRRFTGMLPSDYAGAQAEVLSSAGLATAADPGLRRRTTDRILVQSG